MAVNRPCRVRVALEDPVPSVVPAPQGTTVGILGSRSLSVTIPKPLEFIGGAEGKGGNKRCTGRSTLAPPPPLPFDFELSSFAHLLLFSCRWFSAFFFSLSSFFVCCSYVCPLFCVPPFFSHLCLFSFVVFRLCLLLCCLHLHLLFTFFILCSASDVPFACLRHSIMPYPPLPTHIYAKPAVASRAVCPFCRGIWGGLRAAVCSELPTPVRPGKPQARGRAYLFVSILRPLCCRRILLPPS